MASYMLDTDSVSYGLRGQGRVAQNILARRPSELCMSALTLAELRYGAERKHSKRLHALIDTFADSVSVVAFDDKAAARFGAVAAQLAHGGAPIGTMDVLIAAHALAVGSILVTNNLKHFSRVRALRSESWY